MCRTVAIVAVVATAILTFLASPSIASAEALLGAPLLREPQAWAPTMITEEVRDGVEVLKRVDVPADAAVASTSCALLPPPQDASKIHLIECDNRLYVKGTPGPDHVTISGDHLEVVLDGAPGTLFEVAGGADCQVVALRATCRRAPSFEGIDVDGRGGDDRIAQVSGGCTTGSPPSNWTLRGGADNDEVSAYSAFVSIFGDAGDDILTIESDGWDCSYVSTVSGGSGADRMMSFGLNNALYYAADGVADRNILFGEEGASGRSGEGDSVGGDGWDWIVGSTGRDVVRGSANHGETFVASGGGDDVRLGGAGYLRGVDTYEATGWINRSEHGRGDYVEASMISYLNSPESVSLDLSEGASGEADQYGHRLVGVTAAYGSRFDDRLLGSSENDSLYGFDGGDYLRGREGSDILDAGTGADFISAVDRTRDGWIDCGGSSTVDGDEARVDWDLDSPAGCDTVGYDGDPPPPEAQLETPVDNASYAPGNITFTWKALASATSYRLLIDGRDQGVRSRVTPVRRRHGSGRAAIAGRCGPTRTTAIRPRPHARCASPATSRLSRLSLARVPEALAKMLSAMRMARVSRSPGQRSAGVLPMSISAAISRASCLTATSGGAR